MIHKYSADIFNVDITKYFAVAQKEKNIVYQNMTKMYTKLQVFNSGVFNYYLNSQILSNNSHRYTILLLKKKKKKFAKSRQ